MSTRNSDKTALKGGVRRGRPSVPRMEVQCAACPNSKEIRVTEYEKSKTKRFFCGQDDCGKKVGQKLKRGTTETCPVDGVDFYRKPKDTKRYCSPRCAAQARYSAKHSNDETEKN